MLLTSSAPSKVEILVFWHKQKIGGGYTFVKYQYNNVKKEKKTLEAKNNFYQRHKIYIKSSGLTENIPM